MTVDPRRAARAATALLAVALLAGCASAPADPQATNDPLEDTNRTIYAFNETVDEYALAPAARAWTWATPAGFRRGVGNFFDNLSYPGTVLNNLLQGKGEAATRDTIRFVINSTLGLAGFLDPASDMGLEKHSEDFGQTLGVWGADAGPFLMLPLLGPSSGRDVTQYPVSWYTDVLTYAPVDAVTSGGLLVVNVVNTRAQLDRAVSIRDEAALDPYTFTRSSYRQMRLNRVYDGNPPQTEDPYGDFFNDGPGGNGDGGDGPLPPAGDG